MIGMKHLALLLMMAGSGLAQTYCVNGPNGPSTITVSRINGGCQWVQMGVGVGGMGSIQGPSGSSAGLVLTPDGPRPVILPPGPPQSVIPLTPSFPTLPGMP
jgi:hypothetical protein